MTPKEKLEQEIARLDKEIEKRNQSTSSPNNSFIYWDMRMHKGELEEKLRKLTGEI